MTIIYLYQGEPTTT